MADPVSSLTRLLLAEDDDGACDMDYIPIEETSTDEEEKDVEQWACADCSITSSKSLGGKECCKCKKRFCEFHSYPYRDFFYEGCQSDEILLCRRCWIGNETYCSSGSRRRCICLNHKDTFPIKMESFWGKLKF